MNFLSPDSKLMRGLSNLVDGVIINLLMLLTSIPVITIGASVTAAHVAARKAIEGEGHLLPNYVRAFKENLLQTLPVWIVMAVLAAGLGYAWIVLQITPLLVPKFGLSIVWIFIFEWVFALQARFANPVGRTVLNAAIFSVSHVMTTLALIAIDAVYIALIIACWLLMPGGLFLLLVLGYGTVIMLHIPLLERVMRAYM